MESTRSSTSDAQLALAQDVVRVCYFGTYDRFNPRNQMMLLSLKRNNVEVVQCHASLWGSTAQKVSFARSSSWSTLSFLFTVAGKYLHLIHRYAKAGPHQIMIIGCVPR